jgi:hypothetical protein
MADLSQTTQQSKTVAPKQYDPMQEVAKKVVSSLGEFRAGQAVEAAQAGKTDEEIIGTLMKLAGTTYQKPTGDKAGFMGPLFGYQPGQAITKPEAIGLDNAMALTKYPGEVRQQPLQLKKLEQETDPNFQDDKLRREEGIKYEFKVKDEDRKMKNEFFSKIMSPPQPLSGESAAKYQFTKDAIDASGQLLELLENNPKSLRELDIIGSNKGQRIGTIQARLIASLVPARAGATQSKQEIDLIKKMASKTGFEAMLKDPEDLKFRLSEIRRSMQSQARVMNPSAEDRELAQHLISLGHSPEDVTDYLMGGGKRAKK